MRNHVQVWYNENNCKYESISTNYKLNLSIYDRGYLRGMVVGICKLPYCSPWK